MAHTISLDGKTALITGAAGGIGRAIALIYAEAGGAVACCDVDLAGAEETAREAQAKGGRAVALACDVADEAGTQRAAEGAIAALGPIRILVSGAAPNDRGGTVLDIALADWQRVLAVNLTGAFLTSRAVLPSMIAAGGGSIILIASQLGRVATAGRPAYCATKGALIQLAKAMAVDHAGQNIRVNTLSPGAVETQRTLHRYGSLEAGRERLGPKHLAGRLGQPREIAEAALFLASDAASFVTGSDLLVDGGYTAV